ncbi:helix-turn-helix domain-containing protein [Carnobacterium pleistocenium]|uniref:helix-turn-helix domain-containing protein n=1 Tax=Carnobacterium pleistocenium TaxID=181073 RepID=UPI0006916A71|nr:helix-turn-helix transcriptional regulator [Carnobacterium pleistocenium]
MELAERLKHEREERKMSQSFVAKELNIPIQLLSSWELGKSNPDLEMIQLLSEFYNFSIDELLNNTPPKKATALFLDSISKMASEDIIELLILGIGLPIIIFAIFF